DDPISFAKKVRDAMGVLITKDVFGKEEMIKSTSTKTMTGSTRRQQHNEMIASTHVCAEFNRILEGSMHTFEDGQCVVMNTRKNLKPTILGRVAQSFLVGTEMYVFESMTDDGLALCSGEIALLEAEVNPFI